MPKRFAAPPKPRSLKERRRKPSEDRPLRKVLGSLKVLGDYPILGGQAEDFLANGDGTTTEFRESGARFLRELVEYPELVARMLVRTAPVVAEAGDTVLKEPYLHPVIDVADTVTPEHPAAVRAWDEVSAWFCDEVTWYRVQCPSWLKWACLELSRRFALEAEDTTDVKAAQRFVVRDSWEGGERALPKVSPETITLDLPPITLTRGDDQPRSELVQRFLGLVAREAISQVNLQASDVEWVARGANAVRPAKREGSAGLKPDSWSEKMLVERMFFDNKPDSDPSQEGSRREKTERVALRLGFLPSPSDLASQWASVPVIPAPPSEM